MKSCPACQRTFEDTFTFCLVDGSILSAPFDPKAAQSVSKDRTIMPSQTEVLPSSAHANDVSLPPTVRSPLPSTIQAAFPQVYSSPRSEPQSVPKTWKRRILLILGVLLSIFISFVSGGLTGAAVFALLRPSFPVSAEYGSYEWTIYIDRLRYADSAASLSGILAGIITLIVCLFILRRFYKRAKAKALK